MDVLGSLGAGFSTFLTPSYLILALAGVVLGTLIGVLPGIGPVGAMSILLGFTLYLGPTASLILFAGIYFGSMYGGSTTSILLNVPGEAMSVITAIDGHAMTQRGRAGPALFIAGVASFVAGTIGIVGLSLFAPVLGGLALEFGPPEYFALTVAGLLLLASLSPGNTVKAIVMVLLGLAIATVGIDKMTGQIRFTFGLNILSQGISFVPVVMGVFGVAEVLSMAGGGWTRRFARAPRLRELLPTRVEARRSLSPMARGSGLGFLCGLLPGSGPIISTFLSYTLERRVSRRRREFGKGAIEGVAGPEAANNGATSAAFVPLMALGLPFTPTMALILAALLLNGIVPGPNFISENPDLFWTVIASMYVGNLLLLLLNVPLVGLFTRLLSVPPNLLMPSVLVFATIGVYTINNSVLDIVVMICAGVVALVLRRYDYSMAPLVLAMVLEDTLESSLRQSLTLSEGSVGIFLTRPIAGVILAAVAAVMAGKVFFRVRRQRTTSSATESSDAGESDRAR